MMPPAVRAAELGRRTEEDGFDAIWWADHLMGWHPDSMWTEDLSPLARKQANPHLYFDPLMMMGVVGHHTQRVRVGVVVTDVIRRPAAPLAQTMLTLDHLTRGRAILGLGSGERLNLEPYGLPFDHPVARLSEGIDVIRRLWEADGPISYDGRFQHLDHAVLGLSPYGQRPPPIWTAAHGPRMLELTGRQADGWIPTKMTPDRYAAGLETIRSEANKAGRDPEAITPAMLAYVLMGPDEATIEKLTAHPLVRALCVLVPPEVFRALGVSPPLDSAGGGFHQFIPSTVGREEAMRIVGAIPPRVVRHSAFCGTPEHVAEQVRAYQLRDLTHLVLWNITPFADPDLTGFSFRGLRAVKDALAPSPL